MSEGEGGVESPGLPVATPVPPLFFIANPEFSARTQ